MREYELAIQEQSDQYKSDLITFEGQSSTLKQ